MRPLTRVGILLLAVGLASVLFSVIPYYNIYLSRDLGVQMIGAGVEVILIGLVLFLSGIAGVEFFPS
jgi:uncharacterized membrane protein YqhA